MAVSGDCTVERLIRKFADATQSKLAPDMRLELEGLLLPASSRLHECLPAEYLSERGALNLVNSVTSPPRTVKKKRTSVPTPQTSAPADLEFSEAQFNEFEFWNSAKKSRRDNEPAEQFEDDELALAIALSLSEGVAN